MLEKLDNPRYKTVSTPDTIVLDHIHKLIEQKGAVVFYEIGVGYGATTLAVAKLMKNRGDIVLFSYRDDVAELSKELNALGYRNIDSSWGSPNNTFSGYHFQLALGFASKRLKPFDLAYVDGGHVFHLDAPAACILKELCNPGGLILFDDWNWSISKSPTLKPAVRSQTSVDYDDEQIEACHLQLVCKVIMDTDPRFEFLGVQDDTAVYRRRL
jgi:SAM-dependent methyltransferase